MKAPVDFLREEAPPRRGWALLVLGAVASVAMVSLDWRYQSAWTEFQRRAQARLEQERVRGLPAPARTPTVAEVRLRRAEADSQAPWLATLRAVEALTQEPVYLRSMTIEPAAGTIKLEAEAPSFAEALAYSEALAEVSILQPALLTSHEQVPDVASGKSSIRFHVVAKWQAR